jgi:uncharacterized linocin/CFP29 family protein
MNHLMRELAPVTDGAWAQIDDEASRSIKHFLAGRRLVDFSGPLGWGFSAVDIGRIEPLEHGGPEGVEAAVRRVLPLVELRSPFSLERTELAAAERGATDLDLDSVIAAGRAAALAEDQLVFHGYGSGGVPGIVASSPHPRVAISDDYGHYPEHVAQAVAILRASDVAGHRPRGTLLHRGDRDDRARWLPGLRAPPSDPRWPGGVGAGSRRRRRPEPARRRLRADSGTGLLHRLPIL